MTPKIALGLVLAFSLGWFAGLVTSTRVNTTAAMIYADGLDMQMQAGYDHQLQAAQLQFQAHLAELEQAIADAKVSCAFQVSQVKTTARKQWRAMLETALQDTEK